MGQIEGQFILVAGPDSALRDAAAARIRAEGATAEMIGANAGEVRAAADKAGRLDAIVNVLRGSDDWGPFADGTSDTLGAMLAQVSAFGDTLAADAALQGLTRAVGVEWAPDDIRVNCLVPGIIDVPELRAFRDRYPHDVDHHIRNTPMRRLGDPIEDFGGGLMLLLSDEACFLVGHPVHADGGQHLAAATFEPGAHFATAR
jgi:hypothetical protein